MQADPARVLGIAGALLAAAFAGLLAAEPVLVPAAPTGPPARIRGQDGAELVYVPGGEFDMGNTEAEGTPVRHVTVEPFYMDRFEVTNALYDEFCRRTKRPPRRIDPDGADAGQAGYPVSGQPYQDAVDYLAWAGRRLPTEIEWEWAARGYDGRVYPWGNRIPASGPPANHLDQANFDAVIAFRNMFGENRPRPQYRDGFVWKAPVGSFPAGASPWGVEDMCGNVWEWTSDWRDGRPIAPGEKPPVGRERVMRGGSFKNPIITMHTYDRDQHEPARGWPDVGFRGVQPVRQASPTR